MSFRCSLRFLHTSICFPIYQVVHRKPHRVEGLEVRHRVWQGNLGLGVGVGLGLGLGLGLGICLCVTAFTMTSMVRDRGKCTGRRLSSIKPSELWFAFFRLQ